MVSSAINELTVEHNSQRLLFSSCFILLSENLVNRMKYSLLPHENLCQKYTLQN